MSQFIHLFNIYQDLFGARQCTKDWESSRASRLCGHNKQTITIPLTTTVAGFMRYGDSIRERTQKPTLKN